MNPLYTSAAASPMVCRRLATTATTSTLTSSSASTSALIPRLTTLTLTPVRHAAHVSKVAARAKEMEEKAKAADTTTTNSSNATGPGPGSADRMMAATLKRMFGDRELTPAEKQKYDLRLMKMKMSRKQFMKWLRAHPQNPVSIPNTKAVLPEGHGENIWLWHHIEAGHVVYSLGPIMDSNKALAQFPYTGKKLVPPALRRDYWRPFAQIRFPAGLGHVGRSVWQKLVELKKRHELEWGHQKEAFLKMSREDRGRAINDQRANVVADIAAVLGGMGKGNKIWLDEDNKKKNKAADDGAAGAKLCEATVFWTNTRDRHYAAKWPANVRHFLGLPTKKYGLKRSLGMDAPEPEPVVEAEGKEGEEKEEKDDDDEGGKPPGDGGNGGNGSGRRGEDEKRTTTTRRVRVQMA